MRNAIITRSLELVGERCLDPAPRVYQRLFEQQPDMRALFGLDTAGLVRGQMLAVAIETLLDYVGDNIYGGNLIRIERINHDGKGIPPNVFDTFYTVMVETFREILGPDWTEETDAAWTDLLAEISGLTPG